MWSLTSQRTKRISGPGKFRSSPKKDFFNTIWGNAELAWKRHHFRGRPKCEIGLAFQLQRFASCSILTSDRDSAVSRAGSTTTAHDCCVSHRLALNGHSTVFRQARGADRSMFPGQRQSTQELRQSDILVATTCVHRGHDALFDIQRL
jgi:hypothetical protein